MNTIYIVALEPIDSRYTGQWFTCIPDELNRLINDNSLDFEVVQIVGNSTTDTGTTSGAFLNFATTNIWKSEQVIEIAKLFTDGKIKAGDKFLFTDAWNPGLLQVKYMSELLDIPVEIHSIWHAGSYDPQDFLGRKIKDKRWTNAIERSFFFASDFCYMATNFHKELFMRTFDDNPFLYDANRIILSGQPHNLLVDSLSGYKNIEKKNLILFPHRVAPEKQIDIFLDLKKSLPQYEFVVCQDQKLTKDEYHQLLGESKVIFSANLQETLGISAMEGVLVDSIPMVPDRLSYSEMYVSELKYPSEWTINYEKYLENKNEVIQYLINLIENYESYKNVLNIQKDILLTKYLTANIMMNKLLK